MSIVVKKQSCRVNDNIDYVVDQMGEFIYHYDDNGALVDIIPVRLPKKVLGGR